MKNKLTNILLLNSEIVKSGLKRVEVAIELGLSLNSLCKKINNKVEFKASEIDKLRTLLKIENPDTVFFNKNVE